MVPLLPRAREATAAQLTAQNPIWEHTWGMFRDAHPGDERLAFAKVDCTQPEAYDVCTRNHINAFPSIRVFTGGSDTMTFGDHHEHVAYRGDRTPDALLEFANKYLSSLGNDAALPAAAADEDDVVTVGCHVEGYVSVNRVPGTLFFSSVSAAHSFDNRLLNASHIAHAIRFGDEVDEAVLAEIPPEHRTGERAGLMGGRFNTDDAHENIQHHIRVVKTTYALLDGTVVDAHDYVVNSHSFKDNKELPRAKFTYDFSPMQVVVTERRMATYQFVTSLCAIIGGVFTVAGIIDGIVHTSLSALEKKVMLGKAT